MPNGIMLPIKQLAMLPLRKQGSHLHLHHLHWKIYPQNDLCPCVVVVVNYDEQVKHFEIACHDPDPVVATRDCLECKGYEEGNPLVYAGGSVVQAGHEGWHSSELQVDTSPLR